MDDKYPAWERRDPLQRVYELAERIATGQREVASLPGHFEVLKYGFLYAQVCSDLEDVAEIARRLELVYPAGTRSGWTLDTEVEPGNPVPCTEHLGRKHWVFVP